MERSKWSSMARFPRPVTMSTSSAWAATASSTTYWMTGLSTTGSISLGCDLVTGRKRVPSPAAGMIAFICALSYSVFMTSVAASTKRSISSSVCAIETKHASYWLGASQKPLSSMPRKYFA